MSKEYLDGRGNPLIEGFYKDGNILLQIRYISPDNKGGWKCELPSGHIVELDSTLSKNNMFPLSNHDAFGLYRELSTKADFIKSKLEQLSQPEQPIASKGRGQKPKYQRGVSTKNYSAKGSSKKIKRYIYSENAPDGELYHFNP